LPADLTADSGKPEAVVARHLVLADVAHQYPLTPSERAPVLVAELDEHAGGQRRALEFLKPAMTAARSVTVLGADETILSPPGTAVPSWSGIDLTTEFGAYLRTAVDPIGRPLELSDSSLSALAPVMLLRTNMSAEQPYTEVLMCARVRTMGVLFVRVSHFHHSASVSLADRVAEAFRRSGELRDRIRVQGNSDRTFEKGVEIEEKITLLDEASAWAITKDIWAALENGDFPGFIPDPGYELTRWCFTQQNFEVTGPPEKRGHYAFADDPNGGYYLRKKNFAADALRRAETIRLVDVPESDFPKYLAREFPDLQFRRLPAFVRTRFDLNVQSVVTGHCFGVETDEVTVLDGDGRKLRQVEMEYLQTWWHDGMDASTIDAELSRLTDLVQAYLTKRGIRSERGFYSKLAFLRERM
jgi:hypothetical protein